MESSEESRDEDQSAGDPEDRIAKVILESFLRRRGYWKRRLRDDGLEAEADDAIQDALVIAVTHLKKECPTGPEDPLESDVCRRWTNSRYQWTTIRRRAYVLRRRRHDTPVAEPIPLPDASRASTDPAELALERVDRDQTLAAIRTALRVLVDRGERLQRGTFASRVRYWVYAEAVRAHADGSDHPVHEAARRLGLTDVQARQHMTRLQRSLLEVRYAAGVLGGPGWLLHDADVDRALDSLDRTPSRDKSQLRSAARAVTTTTDTGTRVDLELYIDPMVGHGSQTPFGESLDPIDDLHRAESDHARTIRATQPNCVTMCPDHNPTFTRITEF